jgi:predicted ATPase
MAARRPLVVRVDDLRQADAASRRLLDYLLMQPLPARLCILVTTPSREDADQLERAAMRFSAYSVLRPV